MRRFVGWVFATTALIFWANAATAACGPCKAERVTTSSANSTLFGGSDSAGGVGDWYVTNGTVVAIIDDIDTTTIPTVGGSAIVDITSSNAVETGGTLVDLGLKGKHNDQFPQAFNTGGLSLANVFLFRKGDETVWGVPVGNNPCASVGAANAACPLDPVDADCAAVTVYGIMLGPCKTAADFCSTRTAPTMRVKTTYKACKGSRALQMRTEVWNQSGNNQALPIFDVFLWGGRGLVPFAADNGRGFTHPELDLGSAAGIVAALTSAPYFAIPGNVDKKDGTMSRGKKASAVSYGYLSNGGQEDSNGPTAGGTVTLLTPAFAIQSLQSSLLSAATLPTLTSPTLANGASRIFSRQIVVGSRNDVASVVGDKKNPQSILQSSAVASLLGTISGKLSPGSSLEGTITFIRTGGTDLTPYGMALLNTAPISQVRTKSAFSNVQLPDGTYVAKAVVPGRDEVTSAPFTVTAGINTVVPPIPLPKTGKLKIEIRDSDLGTGIPAKVSLSPSPNMRRDLNAYVFDTRSGMCSNNFNTTCTSDVTCGGGNTCFRTCTNEEPEPCNPGCPGGFLCASDNKCRRHGCNTDGDCDVGYVCRADTETAGAETYPGTQPGGGQAQVIYADKKGKAQVDLKPGSYTLTVSRGMEYTIRKVSPDPVTITAGATTDVGIQTIKRVVDTSGYLSADFHIHSGRSLDSSVPLEARVRSFAGEGLEVMVSTDHDINTDYAPVIKKVGMQPFLTSIIGTEVTTSVSKPPYIANAWGHLNSWPSEYEQNRRRGGSVEDESVSANVIYDRLRAQSNFQCVSGKRSGLGCVTNSDCGGAACTDVGEQVIQINHPRAGLGGVTNIGIFDNIGYNPAASLDTCQKYPVVCGSSTCNGGSNDGVTCTTDVSCTGGGKCSCGGGSIPGAANGCNNILRDLNVVPQATICSTPGCGSGFEGLDATRNIDGDLMEIDNGGTRGGIGNLKLMRRDWLSLLNQGIAVGKNGSRHQMWGSGVSDTHRVVAEIPGFARTFVGAGELPLTPPLNTKSFNLEVLGGNMSVSSGPYITFVANSGGPDVDMGSTLGPSVSSVNLKIKVQAPPWVPVDEVRIIKNGCVLACYNTTTSPAVTNNPADPYEQTNTNVVRFDATIVDSVSSDSYYIVEASQNLPAVGAPPLDDVVDSVAANVLPYAFSNPILVDGSGDSEYTGIGLAPGLGEPTCGALPPSCSAGAATAAMAPTTMLASAQSPPAANWLVRLLDRVVRPAVAESDPAARVADDSERVRQHEEDLRKPNDEHVPWHLIEFPTPAPTPTH